MDRCKVGKVVGATLVVIGVLGLTLAIGNLASLPSIRHQLLEAMPTAETAIAEAVWRSQTKSYYGLAIFGTVLMCGGALIGVSRHRCPAESGAAGDGGA